MPTLGFNINMKNSPEEIRILGEEELATGYFGAVEITYHENAQSIDTYEYNSALRELVNLFAPHVTVHISNFDLSEENSVLRSAIIHEFINCCEYVKTFNGHEIIMHNGAKRRNLRVPITNSNGDTDILAEEKKCWDLAVKMMQICCDIAETNGIQIYTENLGSNCLTPNGRKLNNFIKDVDRSNLGIVYDIGHGNLLGLNAGDEVRECSKNLKHLHLHDNMGDRDAHLPIGMGNIDC